MDKVFRKNINKKSEKESKKSLKLDLKTWLYLYITKAVKVNHMPIVEANEKQIMNVKDTSSNEVYIFKNYDEYKKYFLMFLDEINEELINLAIYTKGKNGQIVALKSLCEYIIVKNQINKFYSSITQDKIDEIHLKGKLTPLEAVQQWETYNLCIEGSKTIFSKNRCHYFGYNCHACLMETASHKLEHEPLTLESLNSINENDVQAKKLVKNKN